MSDEYEYEIYNCFKEGVILVKTEQQAKSVTKTLRNANQSAYTYKKLEAHKIKENV